MLKILVAILAGGVFAAGLVLSGMVLPAKVQGFLNLGGLWDPQRFGPWDASLAFVMGGALLVTLPAFAVTPPTPRHPARRPWLATAFRLPTRNDIDTRLVLGAALFGVGWGLAGYCPGPALASVLTGGAAVAVFVAAMLVGMAVAKRL